MINGSYSKFFNLEDVLEGIKEYLPDIDSKLFLKAFEFAENAHRGQFRKDSKTPYISHPVEVVKILISLHADEETLITALLHDVPEDTKYDITEIDKLFGHKIAFLVDGITKLSKVQYQNNMPEREVESLKKLLFHSAEDIRVILIKLADRLHNMRTLWNITEPEKRLRIAKETLEVYVPMANLLGIRGIKAQLENLCFEHIFPAEYEELSKKMKVINKEYSKTYKQIIKRIEDALIFAKIPAEISVKQRNIYSVYKYLSSKGKPINSVEPRLTIKAVVDNINNCYQALGYVHAQFVPQLDRFKDYIAHPKMNGYQSIHTAVFGLDGVLTDIQIKTHQMDIEADYGITADFFLKDANKNDAEKSTWVKNLLKFEQGDEHAKEFLDNLKSDVLQDRMVVFSSKGVPMDLPVGATVIDFAYASGSDIGNHVIKADINGNLRPITEILHPRDVIRLFTSNESYPQLSWLSFVKTTTARNQILSYKKDISREKKIDEGRRAMQKELDLLRIGLVEDLNFKSIIKYLEQNSGSKFSGREDVFAAIGEGKLRATDIAQSIHKSRQSSDGKKISLKIVATNRFGLLRDISEVLYRNVTDMYYLKGWSSKHEEQAFFTAKVLVADIEKLSYLFNELEQIDGIISIHRVSQKGVVLFSVAVTGVFFAWLAYPFLLGFILNSKLPSSHPVISGFLQYGGIMVLIVLALYLHNTARKYFPVVRDKKIAWVIYFSIPLAAVTSVIIELIYFGFNINWLVVFPEIVLVYIYLFIQLTMAKKIMTRT